MISLGSFLTEIEIYKNRNLEYILYRSTTSPSSVSLSYTKNFPAVGVITYNDLSFHITSVSVHFLKAPLVCVPAVFAGMMEQQQRQQARWEQTHLQRSGNFPLRARFPP